jgi:hypothetical protein
MSINALEKALWQAYTNRGDTQRYLNDREAYLAGFELDEKERAMLRDVDVMGQINHGANPLLVMMVWQAVHGIERLEEYFTAVNGPTAAV